ncbi:Clp protease N-terminal domain-containing protein [Kibdelosporangium aridum]
MRTARQRRIASEHVLLAILVCEPDPAAELMAQRGVDRATVRERIRLSES